MTPNWKRIYSSNIFMKNIVVGSCVNLFTLVICMRKWHILGRFSWLNFCLTGYSLLRSTEGNLVRGICSLWSSASTSLWLISSDSNLPNMGRSTIRKCNAFYFQNCFLRVILALKFFGIAYVSVGSEIRRLSPLNKEWLFFWWVVYARLFLLKVQLLSDAF